MTHKANISICALWEDEIRAAAELLTQMREASEEDWPEAAKAAMRACEIALYGADNKEAIVLIESHDLHKRVKP